MEEDTTPSYHHQSVHPFRRNSDFPYRCGVSEGTTSRAAPTEHNASCRAIPLADDHSATTTTTNPTNNAAAAAAAPSFAQQRRSIGAPADDVVTRTSASHRSGRRWIGVDRAATGQSTAGVERDTGGGGSCRRSKPPPLGMTAVDDENDAKQNRSGEGEGDVVGHRSLHGAAIDGYSYDDKSLPSIRTVANNNSNRYRYRHAASTGDGDAIVRNNNNDAGDREPPPPPPQPRRDEEDRTSLFEETRQLFQDYRRRFRRQSLTDKARDLYDRAGVLAKSRYQPPDDDDVGEPTERAASPRRSTVVIDLCAEALALCKTAIEDQEAAMNDAGIVGGSYLVTGDIRLRRGAEALLAKIHWFRAAALYEARRLDEALEDCDVALALRNDHRQRQQQHQRQRKAGGGGGGRTVVPTPMPTPSIGRFPGRKNNDRKTNRENEGSESILPPTATHQAASVPPNPPDALAAAPPPGSTSGPPRRITTTTTTTPSKANRGDHRKVARSGGGRGPKSDRKHARLCLLKGRVLSAMGRYREASEWLAANSGSVGTRRFRGEVSMNRFLDRLSARRRSGGAAMRASRRKTPNGENAAAAAATATAAIVPSDARLWPNLVRSVDRRLGGGGMPGKFRRSGGRNGSNGISGSAIYQMLRHGPVLFHHSGTRTTARGMPEDAAAAGRSIAVGAIPKRPTASQS